MMLQRAHTRKRTPMRYYRILFPASQWYAYSSPLHSEFGAWDREHLATVHDLYLGDAFGNNYVLQNDTNVTGTMVCQNKLASWKADIENNYVNNVSYIRVPPMLDEYIQIELAKPQLVDLVGVYFDRPWCGFICYGSNDLETWDLLGFYPPDRIIKENKDEWLKYPKWYVLSVSKREREKQEQARFWGVSFGYSHGDLNNFGSIEYRTKVHTLEWLDTSGSSMRNLGSTYFLAGKTKSDTGYANQDTLWYPYSSAGTVLPVCIFGYEFAQPQRPKKISVRLADITDDLTPVFFKVWKSYNGIQWYLHKKISTPLGTWTSTYPPVEFAL